MEAHTLTNYIPEFITLPLKVREYILTIKQPFEALISIGGNMGLTCVPFIEASHPVTN